MAGPLDYETRRRVSSRIFSLFSLSIRFEKEFFLPKNIGPVVKKLNNLEYSPPICTNCVLAAVALLLVSRIHGKLFSLSGTCESWAGSCRCGIRPTSSHQYPGFLERPPSGPL